MQSLLLLQCLRAILTCFAISLAMPPVVVLSPDRKRTVLVAANSYDELLEKARMKLNLPPELQYKMCVENSGRAIGSLLDDDDLLSDMIGFYAKSDSYLEVILLPSHMDWVNPGTSVESQPQHTPPNSVPACTMLEVNLNIPTSPAPPAPSLRSTTYPSISINPFTELFDPVLEMLKKDPPPHDLHQKKKAALRAAQKEVTGHIMRKVKDYRREVCVRYGTAVFTALSGKFKPIFLKEVGNEYCSDGLSEFICHIYNAVNYSKGSENTMKRGQRRRLDQRDIDDPDDDLEPQAKTPRGHIDESTYGCVNFNPPLPAEETLISQDQKRVYLAETQDLSSPYVVSLFQSTYSSQRSEIISCKSLFKLKDVLVRWPCLKCAHLLVHHASILFNRDVKNLWAEQLDKKVPDIIRFFKVEATRKDAQGTAIVTKLVQILAEKDEAVERSRSQLPNTLSVFLMIIAYMREKEGFFFQHVQSDKLEDVLNAAKVSNGNPILIIQGHSTLDPRGKCAVVVLKTEVIEVSDFLEGILVMFISFFIFGFKYTEGIQNTLEFIQRFFFLINPPAGDKRVHKRRNAVVGGKVLKLSEEIRACASPWSIPSLDTSVQEDCD